MMHTVKTKDNSLAVIDKYTRGKAIKLFCTECFCWSGHPKDCTSKTCPLYPYRGKSEKAYHSNLTPKNVNLESTTPPYSEDRGL